MRASTLQSRHFTHCVYTYQGELSGQLPVAHLLRQVHPIAHSTCSGSGLSEILEAQSEAAAPPRSGLSL